MKSCTICKTEAYCDWHHIQSKSRGGTNAKYNLVELCPNCHRLVHKGELIVEGWFSSTRGRVVVWRKKGEKSVTGIKDPPCMLIGDEERERRRRRRLRRQCLRNSEV